MRDIDWYFDFISPFAYLASHRLDELGEVQIRFRPVLFAGLLAHWDNKGPAEIAPKRLWTYRVCNFRAAQQGIPFRFPRSHPFNPLPWLRLSIAAGNAPHAVRRIFATLWTSGEEPADLQRVLRLAHEFDIDPARLDDPAIKDELRRETDAAAERGVFGVPTLAIDGELFWGADAHDFARAFLADRGLFNDAEMQRVATLPTGARRRDAPP